MNIGGKIIIGIVALLILGGGGYYLMTKDKEAETTNTRTNTTSTTNTTTVTNTNTSTSNTNQQISAGTDVIWEFMGTAWQANGTPPDCPDPLVLQSPVDLDEVTAILYPGQTRGNDYKPHGGFRFDNATSNNMTVTAPLAGYVSRAARYIERGDVQYLFEIVNPCGVMYRFDHLLTLSPKFQIIAETLPTAQPDDSRTTAIQTTATVNGGETIATAVGFVSQERNVSVDFGVYDLRQKNAASSESSYTSSHGAELAQYGVCWFDWLSAADEAQVRILPPGDSASGKNSDYCL